MKKIYSFVLMAMMLLIGTNVWAGNVAKIVETDVEYASLEAAWAAVANKQTIQMLDNTNVTKTLWLGTTTMKATDTLSITLDLKGKTITFVFPNRPDNTDDNGKPCFFITHGSLDIQSTEGTGTITNGSVYSLNSHWVMFQVTGSTYKDVDPKTQAPYTHLTIGSNVTINSKEVGICIDNLKGTSEGHQFPLSNTVPTGTNPKDFLAEAAGGKTFPSENFDTKLYTGTGSGLAYGVRVDIFGNFVVGKYGIKANSELAGPASVAKADVSSYYAHIAEGEHDAYSDESQSTAFEVQYSPYVWIHNGASLRAIQPNMNPENSSNKTTAVYNGGYARVQIDQATCEGAAGAVIKSGDVVIDNATVKSNYTGSYTSAGDGEQSGFEAGGDGIAIISSDRATGGTHVTISGNTTVTGTTGYAIDETVKNTLDDTKVEALTINGGTFAATGHGTDDAEGTIKVTTKTADNQTTTITLSGGTFENGDNGVQIGDESLHDFLLNHTDELHGVMIGTNDQGQPTIVVSTGEAPAEVKDQPINEWTGGVNWMHAGSATTAMEEVLGQAKMGDTKKLTLTELQITQNYEQKVIVEDGYTLEVGRVVLGANAQIVVKAGGKFVVTGAQGLAAYKYSNVVLENEVGKPAVFFFHPGVESNTFPQATVKLSINKGKQGTDRVWTRFAMPLREISAVLAAHLEYENSFYQWNYTANDDQGAWELIANVMDMKSWTGYTVSYDDEGNQVYTFKGNLVGNADAPLNFVHKGYNYFGNSYMGYLDSKTLVESLPADIDGTVYLWNHDLEHPENQGYHSFTLSRLLDPEHKLSANEAWAKDITPMSTFILRLMDKKNAAASVDYASALWENPRHGYPAAPAPRRASDINTEEAFFQVVVSAANGKSDRLNLTENSEFTDAYDRGYDAAKFMNTNSINLFATIDGENYSDVVTNSLESKMISIETVNDVNYTLSFSHADNNEYAIRDNATNQVTVMDEGATYEFTAQPNSVIEGRFEVVAVAKLPTAIDNTEVVKTIKGIYTITGQYVGENFEVLPAGVYVINGVKVVK